MGLDATTEPVCPVDREVVVGSYPLRALGALGAGA